MKDKREDIHIRWSLVDMPDTALQIWPRAPGEVGWFCDPCLGVRDLCARDRHSASSLLPQAGLGYLREVIPKDTAFMDLVPSSPRSSTWSYLAASEAQQT